MAEPAAPTPPAVRPRSLAAVLARGCLAGLLLAGVGEFVHVLLGTNFHTVVPGRFYRCSQPSPAALQAAIRRYGIRTVVNLRGCCDPIDWYLAECRAGVDGDLSQEDINFSAGRLPSVHSMRELVAVLDRSEKPVLIHCHKGIDRTGLASTVVKLLYEDTTLDEARGQLSLRYGHLPLGRTANIDRFFDLYAEWLAKQGVAHSHANFRRWATEDYCPGECRCRIELAAASGDVVAAPRDRPFGVAVRSTNTSVKPWRLRPGLNAGVHAIWNLTNAADQIIAEGRSGLFDAEVAPGETIDLTLSLPRLAGPAVYRLRVDMIDEQHAAFFQVGSEPLFVRVEVP
jgi:protein tyrosine/serine phosphatase